MASLFEVCISKCQSYIVLFHSIFLFFILNLWSVKCKRVALVFLSARRKDPNGAFSFPSPGHVTTLASPPRECCFRVFLLLRRHALTTGTAATSPPPIISLSIHLSFSRQLSSAAPFWRWKRRLEGEDFQSRKSRCPGRQVCGGEHRTCTHTQTHILTQAEWQTNCWQTSHRTSKIT